MTELFGVSCLLGLVAAALLFWIGREIVRADRLIHDNHRRRRNDLQRRRRALRQTCRPMIDSRRW